MATSTIWTPKIGRTTMSAGQRAMQAGYRLSTVMLHETMQQHSPRKLARWNELRDNPEIQILCVDGTYDHMHYILEAGNISHARIEDGRLLDQALKELPSIRTVLINCASSFDPNAAMRAAQFVEAGGLLVTTDWAIENVIQIAFPNTIRRNGESTTGSEFVHIGVHNPKDPNTKLLQTVINAASEPPKWWLEPSSYPFSRESELVEILLYSKELKDKYKNGSVMVRFPWGNGYVIHMISHAFLQEKQAAKEEKPKAIEKGKTTPSLPEQQVAKEGKPKATEKGKSTTLFTTLLGASEKTTHLYEEAEEEIPDFDEKAAATTTLSTAVFLTSILSGDNKPNGNGEKS